MACLLSASQERVFKRRRARAQVLALALAQGEAASPTAAAQAAGRPAATLAAWLAASPACGAALAAVLRVCRARGCAGEGAAAWLQETAEAAALEVAGAVAGAAAEGPNSGRGSWLGALQGPAAQGVPGCSALWQVSGVKRPHSRGDSPVQKQHRPRVC